MPWISSHSLQRNSSLSRKLPSIAQNLGRFSYPNKQCACTSWEHQWSYLWNMAFSTSHLPDTHPKLKQSWFPCKINNNFGEIMWLRTILDMATWGHGYMRLWLYEVMVAWESILDIWEKHQFKTNKAPEKILSLYCL